MERLESRRMLSAGTATGVASPHLTFAPLAASSGFQGYTASQIRHAYGFDHVSGDGSGQTIAIVDAYNDPNIWADLQTFDRAMGIVDPPSFRQVSQSGGSTAGIATDAGWAGEIALDVEWAHAIAPKANILLVEAKSADFNDLMAAVNTARSAAGVSVVSLSWGGSEFYEQTQYDSLFTTPAGHQGVTFVAAAGDNGSAWGPQWPASSANVLSVGGTTLYTSGGNGTYAAETGWSFGGGGVSGLESEPAYQTAAQLTGRRVAPDVAYDANPATGFAVYDSVADGSYVGWQVVGGTSAGAPQWAALVAIADQLRVASGKGTLDGATGTLPMLYKLYNGSTYTASFNDVTSGRTSWTTAARPGYDAVSGLGSPKAPQVIAALSGSSSAAAATVSTTSASSSAATTTTTTTRTRRRKSARTAGVAAQTSSATAAMVTPNTIPPASAQTMSGVAAPAGGTLGTIDGLTGAAASGGLAQISGGGGSATVTPAAAKLFSSVRLGLAASAPAAVAVVASNPASAVIAAAADADAWRTGGAFEWGTAQTAAFADALAAFAHESAAVAAAVMPAAGRPSSRIAAWSATLAAISIDVVLVASWVGSRRYRRRRPNDARALETFCLQPIR